MSFVSLLLTLVVGLFILFGSYLSFKYKNNRKITDFSICMSFGVIIGLILFEILPEDYEILSEQVGVFKGIIGIILLSLIGIIILKLLDLFIPHHLHEAHHHHNHETQDCHNEHLHHIGIVSSIAVIFHNIIEGMSLYLVTSSNMSSGLLLCLGVGLHNIPMGLVIATTLASSNISKKKTLIISLVVSISTFLGGIIMFILGSSNELYEGVLLGLTLGMLIYISVFELAHQVYHMKDKKIKIIGVSFGLALLLISVLLENLIH